MKLTLEGCQGGRARHSWAGWMREMVVVVCGSRNLSASKPINTPHTTHTLDHMLLASNHIDWWFHFLPTDSKTSKTIFWERCVLFFCQIDLRRNVDTFFSRLAVALICAPFAVKNLDDNVVLQYLAVIGLMVMAVPRWHRGGSSLQRGNERKPRSPKKGTRFKKDMSKHQIFRG